ncbi:MAG: acyl-CoA dehydratase activase [Fidelibacterota bacterium]
MDKFFAGVDIGSLTTETVIIDRNGKIVSQSITHTGASSKKAALKSMQEALATAGIKEEELSLIISTGYGREIAPFECERITEITCHAKGAHLLFPATRLIIDVGGQDSKAIRVNDRGKVIDFVMNDKCAAGTGRFLEVMARALEIELEDMGKISLKARKNITISSMCTVFAESEVVSLIAAGHSTSDIANGVHRSIAKRIFSLTSRLRMSPKGGEITMTGGVAKNIGVVRALEERLGKKVNLWREPQIVGALGAALIAKERFTTT